MPMTAREWAVFEHTHLSHILPFHSFSFKYNEWYFVLVIHHGLGLEVRLFGMAGVGSPVNPG